MQQSVVSLISLAMLKVNAEVQNRDYLDYLLPFIHEAIATKKVEQINEITVCEILRSDYGLNIPRPTVGLCLKRMWRRGELASGMYGYTPTKAIQATGFGELRKRTEERLGQLVGELLGFAKTRFAVKWDEGPATDAIASYLSNFGIDCLRAYIFHAPLPTPSSPKSPSANFVVSSFIREALVTSQESFDSVMLLVKGYMLANALLCPDLKSAAKKFSHLTAYLDTPFILRLLGLVGQEGCEAARETINLTKQLGGRIAVFSHTATEVHGVILGAAGHLEDAMARGPLVREMRQRHVSSVDLLLLGSRLDHELATLGIIRDPTPEYKVPYQIDEKILEASLDEDIRYHNPRALQNDINSIRSVYALRAGKEPASLEDCVAVLVTTNAKLARVAYHYGQDLEGSHQVSPVITAFSLANIAWLKQPFAATDLPRLEVIAMCYAALRPPEHLWRKYVESADDLKAKGHISHTDHSLLRTSLTVQKELMQLTLGAEENLTDETVAEILQRVKKEYATEADAQLQLERAEHSKTKAQRQAAEAAQRQLLEERGRLEARITGISTSTGKLAEKMIFVLFFAAVIIASIFAGESEIVRAYIPAKYSIPFLVVLFSYTGHVLLITEGVFGFPVKRLAAGFGDFVQLRTRWLIEWLLYPKQKEEAFITLGLAEPLPQHKEAPSSNQKGSTKA
ncbi:MAG: hypothetical protein WAO35_05755 [Terriglobia bacterium]